MVPLGCGSCRAILAEGDSRPCFAGRFARAVPYMWHIARSAWHVDTACLLLMQKARNAKSTGCLIGDTRRRTLHAVWRRYRPTAHVTAGLWHGSFGRPLQGLYAWHLLVQAMPFGGGRGNGLKTCVPPAAAPGRGRNRVRKEQKHQSIALLAVSLRPHCEQQAHVMLCKGMEKTSHSARHCCCRGLRCRQVVLWVPSFSLPPFSNFGAGGHQPGAQSQPLRPTAFEEQV